MPFRQLSMFCAIALAVLALSGLPAEAQNRAKGRTDRVRIAYVEPKNPEHKTLYENLKKIGVLEDIRTFMSAVRLPATLLLKMEGCDGTVNAWYQDRVVTVCYEYIAEAVRNAPEQPFGEELTRESAIAGAVTDVFLHELAHAVFDMLEIPVFGREEDAADQLAAYIMLQMAPQDGRKLVAGVAYLYVIDAMRQSPQLKHFADAHGLPAQRFFNLLCMAYGAHPKTYADIVEKGYLPKERAEDCEYEYAQVAHAYNVLIAPHTNQKLAERTRSRLRTKKWKEFLKKEKEASAKKETPAKQ